MMGVIFKIMLFSACLGIGTCDEHLLGSCPDDPELDLCDATDNGDDGGSCGDDPDLDLCDDAPSPSPSPSGSSPSPSPSGSSPSPSPSGGGSSPSPSPSGSSPSPSPASDCATSAAGSYGSAETAKLADMEQGVEFTKCIKLEDWHTKTADDEVTLLGRDANGCCAEGYVPGAKLKAKYYGAQVVCGVDDDGSISSMSSSSSNGVKTCSYKKCYVMKIADKIVCADGGTPLLNGCCGATENSRTFGSDCKHYDYNLNAPSTCDNTDGTYCLTYHKNYGSIGYAGTNEKSDDVLAGKFQVDKFYAYAACSSGGSSPSPSPSGSSPSPSGTVGTTVKQAKVSFTIDAQLSELPESAQTQLKANTCATISEKAGISVGNCVATLTAGSIIVDVVLTVPASKDVGNVVAAISSDNAKAAVVATVKSTYEDASLTVPTVSGFTATAVSSPSPSPSSPSPSTEEEADGAVPLTFVCAPMSLLVLLWGSL